MARRANAAVGEASSQEQTPQEPRKWEAEGFRVKWLAGNGIGQSHPVKTEEEAQKVLAALKTAFPEAVGWKLVAIRSRMET